MLGNTVKDILCKFLPWKINKNVKNSFKPKKPWFFWFFYGGLNHGLNQWFKPIGLNQATLPKTPVSLTYPPRLWIFRVTFTFLG